MFVGDKKKPVTPVIEQTISENTKMIKLITIIQK